MPGHSGKRDGQPIDRREQRNRQIQPVGDGEGAHVDHGREHEGRGESHSRISVNAPLIMIAHP